MEPSLGRSGAPTAIESKQDYIERGASVSSYGTVVRRYLAQSQISRERGDAVTRIIESSISISISSCFVVRDTNS